MSIFNFKKGADEPYELGELIGEGTRVDFYKIKNEKLLGVKIFHNRYRYLEPLEKQVKEFEKEIEIGNLLLRNNIPTPRNVGVIDILIKPESNKIIKGLAIEIIEDETLIEIDFNYNDINLELNHFSESEFSLRVLLNGSYVKDSKIDLEMVIKYKTAICKTLNMLIDKFKKNSKEEFFNVIEYWDLQGLYSIKKDIFYLIDFENWKNFLE